MRPRSGPTGLRRPAMRRRKSRRDPRPVLAAVRPARLPPRSFPRRWDRRLRSRAPSERAAEQPLGPGEGLRGCGGDLDLDQLAGPGGALEVDRLVVPAAPAQACLVGAAGPFDHHLDLAPDESLGPLGRPALDQLDQPLHPLDLDRVRNLLTEPGRLGFAAWREDEGEGAVVAD